MWKKTASLFVVFTLLFSLAAPLVDEADARRYRSPSRSYQPDTQKTQPQRTDRVESGTNNRAGATTPGTAAGRTGTGGLFGGGLMRGMMLGGLAGLMFGGLLSGLGAFGSLLGLIVNVLAIVLVFMLVRKLIEAFSNRNRPRDDYR